jgi:hypothetical protein
VRVILSTLQFMYWLTYSAVPTGQPNISTPDGGSLRISAGKHAKWSKEWAGDHSSHLLVFNFSSILAPSLTTMLKALRKSSEEPIMFPSSKNQKCRSRSGHFWSISWMIGEMVKENSSGPKGSPCCTPFEIVRIAEPKKRGESEPYIASIRDAIDGAR